MNNVLVNKMKHTSKLIASSFAVSTIVSTILIVKGVTKVFIVTLTHFSSLFRHYPLLKQTLYILPLILTTLKDLLSPILPSFHFYEEEDVAEAAERHRLIEDRHCHRCLA